MGPHPTLLLCSPRDIPYLASLQFSRLQNENLTPTDLVRFGGIMNMQKAFKLLSVLQGKGQAGNSLANRGQRGNNLAKQGCGNSANYCIS